MEFDVLLFFLMVFSVRVGAIKCQRMQTNNQERYSTNHVAGLYINYRLRQNNQSFNGSNLSPFFTGSSPKLKIHSELPVSLIHIPHCTWMLTTLPPDGDTLGMLR